ncbi:type II toxin-antitoxin system HipA family toxin YjjJ [Desulfomicrobium escambiense]|uniref:type II toxin-antitoxin system HipA family toxin YjjJ n=1 Tax=Desulfomicrobium escambiense TaxID=29503 RepID=UPI00040BC251|nr:type II toxin-antitoxin system HipA family toxin YjjJ [Desulfomicrobium escambiense]
MALSLTEFLEHGPATSREIQDATGLSQAAVSRQLRKLGHRVVAIRSGRTPRYVLTRNAFGGGDRLPLAVVDAHGDAVVVAHVRPLVTGGFLVEPTPGMSSLLLGDSGDGSYDDLPYFLQNMGPQGFVGRQIARAMSARFPEFPDDPKWWTTHHIGRFLISNGDDLPGNFTFGEQALLRVRRRPDAVDDAEYPRLADRVMEGEVPGSSAGGEQPKFTAFSGKSMSHVIVKFSPPGNGEMSRRWRDVLITEYHAAVTLRENGFQVAETRLLETGGRLFLESRRFDRAGEYGRMSMISLAAVDVEFVGSGSSWPRALKALAGRGLIAPEHVVAAESLWCFGKLIHNTDMHLGNLSLALDGDAFRLLPVYDMCSMGFAPRSGGEVRLYAFAPRHPQRLVINDETYGAARRMAAGFWDSVARDGRISSEFQEFLRQGNPVEMME